MMSRHPAIGGVWYDRFKSDVFPSDEMVVNGRRVTMPRYYLERFKKEDPKGAEAVLEKRRLHLQSKKYKHIDGPLIVTVPEGDTFRNKVREEVMKSYSKFKRPMGDFSVDGVAD